MDDLHLVIYKYRIFSSTDLKSAYHYEPSQGEGKIYSKFDANSKLYQFCQISFGVANCVVCFQPIMNNLIKQNNLRETYASADNIVIVWHKGTI